MDINFEDLTSKITELSNTHPNTHKFLTHYIQQKVQSNNTFYNNCNQLISNIHLIDDKNISTNLLLLIQLSNNKS